MEFELTAKQKILFDKIEQTDDNFLILGKPGVGKSVLTNALRELGKKEYTIAAPTGLAAINVDGKTLHSLFKIPIIENGIIPDTMIMPDKRELMRLSSVSALIIDEISMVRADTLDYIDRVLKLFRNNTLPFGGIQVIMIGDFCQLPPVVFGLAKKELAAAGYASEFAFDSFVFNEMDMKIYELTEVLRQKDDLYFMEILNAARFGTLNEAMVRDLNALVGNARAKAITLTATNKQADEINTNEMRRLPSKIVTYHARVDGDWPESMFPLPGFIPLRAGAQVMVRKNGADRDNEKESTDEFYKLVNGTLGIIEETEQDIVKLIDLPKVYRQSFNRSRKAVNDEGKHRMEVYATFNQMPLTPAWAISMHKSQGQSFTDVNIDPSKTFAAGQLYVALSRARSMFGMTLLNHVNANKFTVNKNVMAFYESL